MIFNEHILLVIKWLQNNDSVSQEKLYANFLAANKAADVAGYDAIMGTIHKVNHYAAAKVAKVAADAYGAAVTTKVHRSDWLISLDGYLDEYFRLTKENRQAYESRIKHLNVLGVSNE